jgi:hypothetical protein
MDKHLQSMWVEINQSFFAGELKPLRDIDWGETSGPNGIGAHGRFFKSRCIVIDEKFRFDEAAIKAGDKKEEGNAECAYRLLVHEMVHQLLDERNSPQGHGASFLAEVQRISKQMGEEPPTAENATRWPFHFKISEGDQEPSQ